MLSGSGAVLWSGVLILLWNEISPENWGVTTHRCYCEIGHRGWRKVRVKDNTQLSGGRQGKQVFRGKDHEFSWVNVESMVLVEHLGKDVEGGSRRHAQSCPPGTQWTVACQASLSMEFSRQEYWSGAAIFFFRGSSQPRDWNWVSCISCITGEFFTIESPGKPISRH